MENEKYYNWKFWHTKLFKVRYSRVNLKNSKILKWPKAPKIPKTPKDTKDLKTQKTRASFAQIVEDENMEFENTIKKKWDCLALMLFSKHGCFRVNLMVWE